MDTLSLARELIRRPSVSPSDAGCQQLIAGLLEGAGFKTEPLRFGDVDNLWARRGRAAPALVFAGHTDVVPTRAARAVAGRSVRCDRGERHPDGPRRGGHEGQPRRHDQCLSPLRRSLPRSLWLARHADHERRRRRGRRRHVESHGDVGAARRDVPVLRRRRAVERAHARRHRTRRAARQPVGHHDDPRRAGARGLPARGRQSDARAREVRRGHDARARRLRQRVLSADHVPDGQRPQRRRRPERGAGRAEVPLQLPLLERLDARRAASSC